MRSLVVCLLAAFAVVVLPQLAVAQPPGGPSGRGPEMLMKHLDKDQDGVIGLDEVPERAERLQAMLKRADKDGDGKVTADELAEAIKQFRERRGGMHGPGHGPPGRHHGRPGAKSGPPHRHGPPSAHRHHGHGHHFGHHGRPGAKSGPPHRHGPPPGAMRRPLPDPKEVFAKLDKNGDGQLSLDEFTEGMRKFREMHRGGPPHMRRPGPPSHARRPGGPPCARRPGGPPHGRPPMAGGPSAARRFAAVGRAIFEKLDANKDGKVEVAEVPEQRREGFKKLLEKADKDKDGALSSEEAKRVAAFVAKRVRERMAKAGPPCPRPGIGRPGTGPPWRGRGPAAAAERFKAADANKDGKLSKEEAPEHLKKHFDKIDADSDGQLTPEELREAFKKMMTERAKKAAEARGAGEKGPDGKPGGRTAKGKADKAADEK